MGTGPGRSNSDEKASASETDASSGAADLSEDVRRRFLAIVILLNAGILAVSLGAMLALFRAQYRDAALLIAGGAVVLYGAYRRYRDRHEVLDSTG